MSTPCDGTEDLLKTYSPSEGLSDAKSVIKGIDNIVKRGRNKYLNDSEMAHITDDAWNHEVGVYI
jgi:ribosomal protein S8